MKKNYSQFLIQIWMDDWGLTLMLCILVFGNFIAPPLFDNEYLLRKLNEAIFLLLTFSGILTLVKVKSRRIFSLFFPIAYSVCMLLRDRYGLSQLYAPMIFIGVAIFAIMIYLIFIKVFSPGPVNRHKIIGSIFIFMLTANLMATLYEYCYYIDPHAFSFNPAVFYQENPHSNFMYFSYTTITTTGYGDIIAVKPIVRSLVIIEQLIGILYPVILIGRLVSMNISNNRES